MGTEEWRAYSLARRSRQVDRRRSKCRSLSYYAEMAGIRAFRRKRKLYYNVVSSTHALSRCETTITLHLQVRRVCLSTETVSLSLGRSAEVCWEPLTGPAGRRSASRRNVQSVCAKQQAARSGRGKRSDAFPHTRRDTSPEARINRGTGPIGQARIVTRMGGDKAAALAS